MSNENKIIEEGMSQAEMLERAKAIQKKYGITNQKLDAIGEIGNISMGAAATTLASILGKKVLITSPIVEVVGKEVFYEYISTQDVMLDVKYTKGIEIDNYLLIDTKVAKSISAIMMGGAIETEEEADNNISEMELSAVQEAMNQMMGRAATSMSDLFSKAVDITPPTIKQLGNEDEDSLQAEGYVRVTFELNIGDEIHSKIVQMLELKQALVLTKELLGGNETEEKTKDLSGLLKKIEKDALGEIANISFGTASTMLSEVLNQKISITAPIIEIVEKKDLNQLDVPCVVLNVDYVEGLNTENILIIKKKVAAAIANLMMGGDGVVPDDADVGEMELSAVQEAMNQMMGNSATAMSEIFQRVVDISPPVVRLVEVDDVVEHDFVEVEDEYFVKITFDLMIGDLIKSQLVQAVSIEEGKKMAKQLLELTGKVDETEVVEEIKKGEKPAESAKKLEVDANGVSQVIKKAKVHIDVVFGNSSKKLEELLVLKKGDVFKLLEGVDEPLKILANNVHVGYGNIVNVGENFAVEVVHLIER